MVLTEKIKETLLKATIESIQNRKIEENLFSTNTGKILRNEIESINNISKYQWNYRLNQIDSPRDYLVGVVFSRIIPLPNCMENSLATKKKIK